MADITSIEAFETIKNNGTLNGFMFQAYEFVAHHPYCTQRDAINGTGIAHENITPCFAKLVKMKLIECPGTTNKSGYRRKAYLVTGETVPQKIVKIKKYVISPREALENYRIQVEMRGSGIEACANDILKRMVR